TIISRGDVEIESLIFDDQSKLYGSIEGRFRFYDGSLLEFDEVVLLHGEQIVKLRYAYHYQNSNDELIFRYDNVSHHPHISTYPHHKHVGNKVEPAQIPDLNDVLREIEQLIYNTD
ncbi:MAG: hypothetical protein GY845_15875, partial [Planctomycetes bacterium]|nr:hypothetical protein [Planctomycetota bacterium]